jgi:hypothetical protein
MTTVERMLEALRRRMLVLLRQSPDPKWELGEMSRLIYEDFPAVTADSFRPVKFVNDVFGDGVSAGRRMAEYALEQKEEGVRPAGSGGERNRHKLRQEPFGQSIGFRRAACRHQASRRSRAWCIGRRA